MTTGLSHAQGELLAQVRPSVTTAITLYQAVDLRAEITLLIGVVIEGGSSTKITLYHDDNGTTYNDDTVIATDTKIEEETAVLFQAQHPGSGIHIKPGGSLGVKVSNANQVNFSLYGVTETIAQRVRGA